ncbi:hypothetical protein CY35_04G125100 [Sphagnum magellanicum]|nr:hypothetical protein CY35_04G125100 [Sphagnum magellanicum]KAH9566320.1 hypothetical protein CY35_04G125100 [Sphagnum magellanicum]KAH9566321.1 hypothetical protein CY35_04G125100 [Sphagnum magellanicum]
MSVSMKNVDAAFQGVGQKPGMDIWRIENFKPIPLPKSSFGKFYTGDSYIILRTTALKSGAFHYDIHFWLGKDTSQDEAGAAAIKTVELDAALGGRAVQFRETQGHETEKFLTYFKPCIIPLEGGVASGFKKVESEKVEPRLFVVKGRRAVRVNQVPFSRSSLNHDDVFVLDTASKIFQFNGANSSIQERGKALEVLQHIKDTDHEGKCEVIIVDDGTLGSEADTGQFWGLFGGFAPLVKKLSVADDSLSARTQRKLFCVVEGKIKEVESALLRRDMLDTSKCYLLDCGSELFIWTGRNTSLDLRKAAIQIADEYLSGQNRPQHTLVTRVIEGFETLDFRSNFDKWPLTGQTPVSEEGRGKVAAMLKQQGVNVKGLLKAAPVKEEVPELLNSSGKLQVWKVDGNVKSDVPLVDVGKFYDNSCYIVLYTYQGDKSDRKEEYLLCYWLGQQASLEDKAAAATLTNEIYLSLKERPVQARIFQGKEPPQFLALFQCMCILKGSTSPSQKENKENTIMLVQVRGGSRHITQAVQVEPLAVSLNSSDCFLLQSSVKFYSWSGNLSTPEDQKVALQVAGFLKPGVVARPVKEGLEPPIFWSSLGGKRKYPSHREPKDGTKDPRLFHCSLQQGTLKVTEVFNFTQDDLLSEDIMILDGQNAIHVWVGQHTSSNDKVQAWDIAQKYLERAAGLEVTSRDTPVFRVLEGNEPSFFTTYFSWDPSKAIVGGDAYTRKLAALQGRPALIENSKRRMSNSPSGSEVTSTQRAAAMAALTPHLTSEIPQPLSSPAPGTTKIGGFHRMQTSSNSQRAAAMAALSSVLGTPATPPSSNHAEDDWITVPSPVSKVDALGDSDTLFESTSSKSEDGGEENEEISEVFGYERLKASSTDPAPKINLKRREAYLSSEEFEKLFGITQTQFYEMPKWKQDQRKKVVDLF